MFQFLLSVSTILITNALFQGYYRLGGSLEGMARYNEAQQAYCKSYACAQNNRERRVIAHEILSVAMMYEGWFEVAHVNLLMRLCCQQCQQCHQHCGSLAEDIEYLFQRLGLKGSTRFTDVQFLLHSEKSTLT